MSNLKNIQLQTLVIILMAALGLVPLAFPAKYHHQSFQTKSEALDIYGIQSVIFRTEFKSTDKYAMSEPFSSGPLITFQQSSQDRET